ncbi:MAG: lysostaphin resistance A-like protein [Planctomycetia bacterium]
MPDPDVVPPAAPATPASPAAPGASPAAGAPQAPAGAHAPARPGRLLQAVVLLRGRGWLGTASVFYGLVALFALGYALFSGQPGALVGERLPSGAMLAGGLGAGLLLVLLAQVATRVWGAFAATREMLVRMLGPLGVRDALLLALLSGVAEELLFRGALWPHLGLVGTSLLFGLMHLIPHRALWSYPLFATAAGFLLGLLRSESGSVLPPVIAHVTVNAINLAWLGREARRQAKAAALTAAAPAPAPAAPPGA